jgi:serine/threonine-protein kinase
MICARCYRRYDGDTLFCPHDGERLVDGIDIKRVRSKPTEHHGRVIGGRYQVRGQLGRGAMAQILLALDQKSGTPVAVKVLDAKLASDKTLVARFLLEAQAAAKVTHRSIVEMLDVGLGDGGAPYLVMELLQGESLGDWLRREKRMSAELGIPFVKQIAEALAAVHRAGIVHRDVKPDNLFLLGEKGEPHTAKILDFGYAKQDEQGSLTQAGTAVGTVEYMSPEQTVSDRVDARTDVYGLGVVMYRMFTGRLPFVAADATEMLARHLIEDPGPLGVQGIDALSAIVLKALRKSPAHRYGSMEALLGDLARLERGEPLAARVPLDSPDVYQAKQAFARQAVDFLHRRLGKEPPR